MQDLVLVTTGLSQSLGECRSCTAIVPFKVLNEPLGASLKPRRCLPEPKRVPTSPRTSDASTSIILLPLHPSFPIFVSRDLCLQLATFQPTGIRYWNGLSISTAAMDEAVYRRAWS